MKNISQVLLLGVPFDNLTLDGAVDRILNLAGQCKNLGTQNFGRAKLVATVNVDFLTNALAWRPHKPPRHPELLHILRQADLVTADGMPLVWLSKLLNLPLKERVAGSDLVPALAKAASETGQSLFLLGGKGYVAHKAAEKLKKQFPNLNIAGAYSPFVYSEGEKMLDSEQDDQKIVEHINNSGADILLIGFGNPKQELFFHRNQHRLKIGVAIGVGGTFEFITGRVARAPVWMQKTGLEWLFRITQDPARLWKRYAIGLAKLITIVAPLLVFHKLFQWLGEGYGEGNDEGDCRLITNPQHSLSMNENNCIQMPVYACGEIFPNNWFEETAYRHISDPKNAPETEQISFDFSHTKLIDAQALANLVRVLTQLNNQNIQISFIGLKDKHVLQTLKLNHVWDIFSQAAFEKKTEKSPEKSQQTSHPIHSFSSNLDSETNPEWAMDKKSQITIAKDKKKMKKQESGQPSGNGENGEQLIQLESQQSNLTIASMDGRLDAHRINGIDMEGLLQPLGDRNGILDLSNLQFVDSTGLRVFFKIKQRFTQGEHQLVLSGINETVMQLILITKIDSLFLIAKDVDEAKGLLNKASA